MERQQSIRRLAEVMAFLSLVAAIALPIIAVLIWVYIEELGALAVGNVGVAYDLINISVTARIAGVTVALIGAGLQVYGLLSLRKTFQEAAQSRWFSVVAVLNFRRFAWVSVIAVFYHIIQNAAYSAILTALGPSGKGQLAINVGTPDIKALFTALLFVFAAHIFAAGRMVEEENKAFL